LRNSGFVPQCADYLILIWAPIAKEEGQSLFEARKTKEYGDKNHKKRKAKTRELNYSPKYFSY